MDLTHTMLRVFVIASKSEDTHNADGVRSLTDKA